MLCPLTCMSVVMGWDWAGSKMRADTRLSALAEAAACLPIDLQVWAAVWPYQLVTSALPSPSVNSESASEGSEHPSVKTPYLQINSTLARKQRPCSLKESILIAFPHEENKGKNGKLPPIHNISATEHLGAVLTALDHTERLPWCLSSKESDCRRRRHKRCGFNPWVRQIPWRRTWQPVPVFLLGEYHGQRSLMGYRSWGQKRVSQE